MTQRRAKVRSPEEYLAPVTGLGVPVPRYDGRSIVNIPSTIAAALGVEADGSPPLAPPLDPDLDPISSAKEGPILVVLVDGLGWYGFRRWSDIGETADQRVWSARARPITSVFPTTTTSALTSLSSGVAPGCHGVVGAREYLPRYGVVADMLSMSPVGATLRDQLVGPQWAPRDVSGAPTIFRRGVEGVVLSRREFADQGFTRMISDGAEFRGYATATDLVHELIHLFQRPRPPAVIYLYWDELDTIQHLKGPSPELVGFEMDHVARSLRFAADHVPPSLARSTTVLITGDHGQVATTRSAALRVDVDPELMSDLGRPVAGDRRAAFFTARKGTIDHLRATLEARVPSQSVILPVSQAIAGGLLGPPPFHPELEDRLGDLLVLVPSPAGIVYVPPGGRPSERHHWGGHGGLEAEELVVPLITGSLWDLGDTGGRSRPTPIGSSPRRGRRPVRER
ncbi:MAG: alkaline phosphatase family protein [Thermoplasmata archaeon]